MIVAQNKAWGCNNCFLLQNYKKPLKSRLEKMVLFVVSIFILWREDKDAFIYHTAINLYSFYLESIIANELKFWGIPVYKTIFSIFYSPTHSSEDVAHEISKNQVWEIIKNAYESRDESDIIL